jgi:FMN phosphatase YigB (HAD superfamily)
VSRVRAVVFDVGETLYSEERAWAAVADWLGVHHWTLAAALGATIANRDDHGSAVDVVRPAGRAGEPPIDPVALYDLYDGAKECLARLRDAGLRVGVAANQPRAVAPLLEQLLEPGELMGISDQWGVSKPDPEFFARVVRAVDLPAEEIVYVGDRVDNDVLPAAAAGMVTVHVRQGPWGVIQAGWPEASRAALRVDRVADVAAALVG